MELSFAVFNGARMKKTKEKNKTNLNRRLALFLFVKEWSTQASNWVGPTAKAKQNTTEKAQARVCHSRPSCSACIPCVRRPRD